ncbi:MAG: LysE family translocator [Anaerolineae bacterium]
MLTYFWQGLLLGGAAAAQPGPIQAFLFSLTLRHGWRRAALAALAPLISDGPIIALVLLILTQTPDWFLNGLRIFGGVFLIFLAWRAYVKPPVEMTDGTLSNEPAQTSLWQTVMVNLLNPNPYIFWATIAGPIFLAGWRQTPVNGIGFAVGFYSALVGGFVGFVVLFSMTRRFDPRAARLLNAGVALVMAVFGIRLLWEGGLALL